MVVPNTTKAHFSRRDQYDRRKMIYDYRPRIENSISINNFISNSKKNIVLAPRYRVGMKRNWPYWNEFYDLIEKSKLRSKYNFIVCGNDPDYIKDSKNRFYDINHINNQYTTKSGLLIEVMKRSILTVGSQSAIPNISLLFGVEALEWGHEKIPHTKTYNINKTKVTFIENHAYDISPKIIFNKMLKILGE